MKTCAKCKLVLDESAFYAFRGDKLQSYCIECMKQYNSEHRAMQKDLRQKERLATRRRLLMR
jgi:hypothetical protein